MENQNKRPQYYAIDIIKFFFAFIVVAAHMYPFSSYSAEGDFLLVHGLARIVVPFFFITAAFLFFSRVKGSLKEDKTLKIKLWLYSERIGVMFFFWTLIINLLLAFAWLLYGVEAGIFQLVRAFFLPVGYSLVVNKTLFNALPIYNGLAWDFSPLRSFVFHLIQPFNQYHLWYFPALALGLVAIYFLYRYTKPWVILALGSFLFLIGSQADSYYGLTEKLPFIKSIVNTYINIFSTSRNGIFYGILFLAIGAWFAFKPVKIKPQTVGAYFGISFLAMFLEAWVLKYYSFQRDFNFLYMAIPASIFLFLLLKECQLKERKLYVWLREASVLIYCSHGLFVILVPVLFNIFGLGAYIENSMVKFWLVFAITASFSWAILWLEKFPRLKFLRYLH